MNECDDSGSQNERRRDIRFPCIGIDLLYSPLHDSMENDVAELLYNASLFDISLKGIAFDLDRALEPGRKIIIAPQNLPSGVQDRLLTEVVWTSELDDGRFRTGVIIREILSRENAEEFPLENLILNRSLKAPATAEFFCPACGNRADFRYIGSQETGRGGLLPLYNCDDCESTRSITSILRYNRDIFKSKFNEIIE